MISNKAAASHIKALACLDAD